MNLEGKTCGECGKGRLHAFLDEISPGVKVDAYKCEFGHVSYSKEVMKQIEALQNAFFQERHVVKVGSSMAVPIPASIARQMRLQPRGRVFVSTQGNRIIIKPSPN